MKELTDEFLVAGIRNKNNEVFEYIYSIYYKEIKWFLEKNNVSDEADIDDIFQETITAVFIKVSTEIFTLECSFKTFIFSICKNLLYERLRIESKTEKGRIFEDIVDESADFLKKETELINERIVEIKKALIRKHFLKLKQHCKVILKMYSKKISFREIAIKLNYKNEEIARWRKRLCKDSLIKMIEKDELYKEMINLEENE